MFVPQAGDDFVLTSHVQDITERAITYLQLGYAVHLSGPAGTGKTTIAMHIAERLGRPCTMLHGDDEFRASDLVGRDTGYRKSSVRDNYVSSIVKTEESLSVIWSANRLTTACKDGHTLIYDEFTRSPAAANNPFLVHKDFRAIFTSNPEEYVGVHKMQDALLDRMITLQLSHPDRETEIAIVRSKSDCQVKECEAIVDVVRAVREQFGGTHGPTVRAAIAIARICRKKECDIFNDKASFRTICQDVLYFNASRQANGTITREDIDRIATQFVSERAPMIAAVEKRAITGGGIGSSNLHKSAQESQLEIPSIVTDVRRSELMATADVSLDRDSIATTIESVRVLPRPPATIGQRSAAVEEFAPSAVGVL